MSFMFFILIMYFFIPQEYAATPTYDIDLLKNEVQLYIDEIDDLINQTEVERCPRCVIDFYYALKELAKEIKENIVHIPESLYCAFIGNHPYINKRAAVRFSENDDINDEEKEFLAQRSLQVKKALENLFPITIDQDRLPKIGMIFSGGGFRSMITTLGFLQGAEEIGILDATMYCAGLSGSTWAIAPWIASQRKLTSFTHEILHRLEDGFDHITDPYELSEMLEIIVTKFLSQQIISMIDIYGAIIANTLLKYMVKKPMLVTMSESHAHIKNGLYPMPIYTSIISNCAPYEWMEFTPFEVGSSFLKSYIPTWAYGRRFKYGSSISQLPEQTLGYCMGIFGSAFEVNLRDIVKMSAVNISYYGHQVPEIVAKLLKKLLDLILASFIGSMRLFPSVLPNFTHCFQNSPIREEKTISLIDAGIDFNLPFPPLLRPARKLDIIIVYDASALVDRAPELLRAEKYARSRGLKFPRINYELADKQRISVFKDENDPTVPIIIYFPRIKNIEYCPNFDPEHCVEHSYCNTFNFAYKPEEAKLLCGFANFVIKEQQYIIKKTIKGVLIDKYNYEWPDPIFA